MSEIWDGVLAAITGGAAVGIATYLASRSEASRIHKAKLTLDLVQECIKSVEEAIDAAENYWVKMDTNADQVTVRIDETIQLVTLLSDWQPSNLKANETRLAVFYRDATGGEFGSRTKADHMRARALRSSGLDLKIQLKRVSFTL